MRSLPIQNCKFEFDCPEDFSKLRETSDAKIRFCDQCKEKVYLCATTKELADHSQAGHCVSLVVKACSATSLKKGDVVRITAGVFQSFDATIEDVNPDEDAAKLMVHIFGRVPPFWMKSDDLGIVDGQ